MKPRPELVLVGVALLWGSTFVITKDVVRGVAPFAFLTVRFGLASLALLAIYFFQRRRWLRPSRRALTDGVTLGLLNSAGLSLQVLGQVYTTASKSSFVTALNTPLTPLVALAIYATRPTRPQLLAVVLATAGVALLTYPSGGARFNPGDLLTLGCAALYAFTIVEIARRTPGHDALELTAIQVATAALLFATLFAAARLALATVPPPRLPELLLLEARPFHLDAKLAVELLYMALVCTVVTFAGQTWAMARMSATHAAVIFALEPVFATAMAIGVTGSGEWPGARGAGGAALVMFAVVVSEIRLR